MHRFSRVPLAQVPALLTAGRPVRIHYGLLTGGFVLIEWLDVATDAA